MSNVPTNKAIRAEYRGIRFRSRTEARWAVFLDEMGIRWQYEAEGYELPSGWYLPDFWLPDMLWFFEVKPDREQGTQKAQELAQTVMRNVAITNGPPDVSSGIGFRAHVVDPVNHLFASVKGDVIPWRMNRDQPWRFVKTEFAVLSGELGCFLEIALALAKAQNFSFWDPASEANEPRLTMQNSKSLTTSTQYEAAPKRSGPSLRDRVRGAANPDLGALIERWENVRMDVVAVRAPKASAEEAEIVMSQMRPTDVSVVEGDRIIEVEHDLPYLDESDDRASVLCTVLSQVINRQMGWSVAGVSLVKSFAATAEREAAS